MTVDIDAARSVAEELMVDAVIITRNPKGRTDATMDPDTLRMVDQPGQPAVVYDGTTLGDGGRPLVGMARIHPPSQLPAAETEGGRRYVARTTRVSIPWDAPDVESGDTVTVISSAHDPHLDGKVLIVRAVPVHTHVVTRQLNVEVRSG